MHCPSCKVMQVGAKILWKCPFIISHQRNTEKTVKTARNLFSFFPDFYFFFCFCRLGMSFKMRNEI